MANVLEDQKNTSAYFEELQKEFSKLFPFERWMEFTGIDPVTQKKMYKMVFPFKKESYTKDEKKVFEKLLRYRLSHIQELLKKQKSCMEREGPSKIYEDDTLSTENSNNALITRLEKHEQELKEAIRRSQNGVYGKFGNSIIHPHRLWLVPHSSKTILAKNMQAEE